MTEAKLGTDFKSVPSMNQGFFIAGTDTAWARPWSAVALTRALVARGLRVAVMKPVAAGAIDTPQTGRATTTRWSC